MQWQDIETAPKDGRPLLLRDNKKAWVGSYYSNETYSFGKLERKSEGWTNFSSIAIMVGAPQPTHWCEIPAFD